MNVDLHTHTYPGLGLLPHLLPRLHRLVRRQRHRGGRPHQPRRHLGQPASGAGAGGRGRAAHRRDRDQHAVRGLRDLLARPRLPGDAAQRPGRAAGRRPSGRRRRGLGAPGRRRRTQRLRLLPGHRAHGRRTSSTRWRSTTAPGSATATCGSPSRSPLELGAARTGGSDAHDPGDLMIVLHGAARPGRLDRGRGPGAPAAGARSRTAAASRRRGAASDSSRRRRMWTLEVQTRQRVGFVDISRDVAGLVP